MDDYVRKSKPEAGPQADPEALDRETEAAVDGALGQALPLGKLPMVTEADLPAESGASASAPADAQAEQETPAVTQEDKKPAGEDLVLERKHLLAIRWMHWINFPVLFTMIWSGLLIYWNDSDNALQHAHEVYRVGFGKFTLFRFFPTWFYTNHIGPFSWDVKYHVTEGLSYHFFFMWLFAINGIVYVLYLLLSKEWKFIIPQRKSVREAIQVTLVDLHLSKGLPAQTKYNGAQRIAYTAVILMGFGALVTGLAIYKPTQAHWLTSLLGGYEMARWLHFWLTIGFCAFFLVHVGQVILAGWNNFRSMVSGYEIRRVEDVSLEAERSQF